MRSSDAQTLTQPLEHKYLKTSAKERLRQCGSIGMRYEKEHLPYLNVWQTTFVLLSSSLNFAVPSLQYWKILGRMCILLPFSIWLPNRRSIQCPFVEKCSEVHLNPQVPHVTSFSVVTLEKITVQILVQTYTQAFRNWNSYSFSSHYYPVVVNMKRLTLIKMFW